MAEASIVQEGVDRFRDAFGSVEDEVQRVQRQVRARRKKLEKRIEKTFEARRKDFEKRTRRLRSEIEKSTPVKRLEAWRKDAGKQIEQGVADVLGALQIASKHDVQRIDRKISQLNKKLKEMERAKRPAGQASESAA